MGLDEPDGDDGSDHDGESDRDVVTFRPDRRRLLLLAPGTFLAAYGALTLAHEMIHGGWAGPVPLRLAVTALLVVLRVGNAWLFRYRHRWLVRTSGAGLEVTVQGGEVIWISWQAIAAIRAARRWGRNRLEIRLTREALLPEMDNPWNWMKLAGPSGLVVPLVPLEPGLIELGRELDRRMRS